MSASVGELWIVGQFLQRAVLAVRIDDERRGAVVRAHQLLDDDARQIALARAGAGDDRQMRADHLLHVQHDRHSAVRAREQRADVRAADRVPLLAREDLAQEGVVGEEDRRAGDRRYPGIDEAAQRGVEVAHDRHVQLEEVAGALVVAHHRGDLRRRDGRLGEERIGIELDRDALEDASQHALPLPDARGGVVAVEVVVDVLAVLEDTLLVARDEGILVDRLAGTFGDADGLGACLRVCLDPARPVTLAHPVASTFWRQAKLRLTRLSNAAFSGQRRSSRSTVCSSATGSSGFSCAMACGR